MGTEEWDDLCRESGRWEYIDGSIGIDTAGQKARVNEFGEKVGMARVVEALEANEWEGSGGGVGALGEDDDDDEGDEELKEVRVGGQGVEIGAVVGEERGLKESLLGKTVEGDEEPGGDEDVMALESMMLKMQAVRDMGADLPEGERRRFAAKAVRDVMRTL